MTDQAARVGRRMKNIDREWRELHKWTAEVRPDERVGYWVTFYSGSMEENSPRFRWTQRGATRCARRGIARRGAADRRTSQRRTVRGGEA
jgi:hypothetical protein